jgi:hypothetical protein
MGLEAMNINKEKGAKSIFYLKKLALEVMMKKRSWGRK